jgi:hypothetical protein
MDSNIFFSYVKYTNKLSELPDGSLNENWQNLYRKSSWRYVMQRWLQFSNFSRRHTFSLNTIGVFYG